MAVQNESQERSEMVSVSSSSVVLLWSSCSDRGDDVVLVVVGHRNKVASVSLSKGCNGGESTGMVFSLEKEEARVVKV